MDQEHSQPEMGQTISHGKEGLLKSKKEQRSLKPYFCVFAELINESNRNLLLIFTLTFVIIRFLNIISSCYYLFGSGHMDIVF